MQKNKIDVVKAVCNSAARKLAVLSLAVAVSGGAVASAQMSERDAKKQLSAMSSLERLIETNGDEVKRQRLNALNSDIENAKKRYNTLHRQVEEKKRQLEEKRRQVEEKKQQLEEKRRLVEEKERQLEEKERQLEEKERQTEGLPYQISICAVVAFLQDEIINLRVEVDNLQDELMSLQDELMNLQDELMNLQDELMNWQAEIITLLRQRNALRGELEMEIPEAQRDQAELMDLALAIAETQGRSVEEVASGFFANIGLPQEAVQNIMKLFGHGQQQSQQQQYFGGMLNPFNWKFFGGGKK